MLDTQGLCPLVIGCTGGSGSRVLRNILSASSQIFMDQDCSENAKDSRQSKAFLYSADTHPDTMGRLIDGFMATILKQIPAEKYSQYKYFGWKNPENIRHIATLFAAHPGLWFLHLIRDPAVIARGSLWKKGYKRLKRRGLVDRKMNRDAIILRRWASVNLSVWEQYNTKNPRYLLVRYEDLILKTEETISSIFNWLEVSRFNMTEALGCVHIPHDAIKRGDDVDVSIIRDAVCMLGYGYRL